MYEKRKKMLTREKSVPRGFFMQISAAIGHFGLFAIRSQPVHVIDSILRRNLCFEGWALQWDQNKFSAAILDFKMAAHRL